MNKQAYIPGMCNINTKEVASRKKAMWFGVGLAVVLFSVMILLQLPLMARLVLIIPVYIAVIGYLQTKNKFCVAYGTSGKQNAAEGSATAISVAAAEAIAADKKKARTMNLQALAISIGIMVVVLLIPNAAY